MGTAWFSEPEYSHGFLVPFVAGFLLYRRREMLQGVELTPTWWGPVLMAPAGALYVLGGYIAVDYLDGLSLILALSGFVVLLGGARALLWAWPGLVFLLFMLPLPFSAANALSGPLRSIATQASGFALQLIGMPVVIEGHVLVLGSNRVAVEEACSGLSMLFVFLAMATAVAFVIDRPWLDRVIVLLSALPIAIGANVVRVALTALAYEQVGREAGDFIFHDLAGWLMMPIALVLLWGVLKLIDVVLVPVPEKEGPVGLLPVAAGGAR
jgi:exosortase